MNRVFSSVWVNFQKKVFSGSRHLELNFYISIENMDNSDYVKKYLEGLPIHIKTGNRIEICNYIANEIEKKYPNRFISIDVSENGYGNHLEYEPSIEESVHVGTPGPNFSLNVATFDHKDGWAYKPAISIQDEKKVDEYLEHTYNNAMEKIDKVAAIKVDPGEKVEVDSLLGSIRKRLFGRRK